MGQDFLNIKYVLQEFWIRIRVISITAFKFDLNRDFFRGGGIHPPEFVCFSENNSYFANFALFFNHFPLFLPYFFLQKWWGGG